MPPTVEVPIGVRNGRRGEVTVFDGNVVPVDVPVRKASSVIAKDDDERDEAIKNVRAKIAGAGTTIRIAAVRENLHNRGLDRTQRYLLSLPGVYPTLLNKVLDAAKRRKVKTEDTVGMADMLLLELEPTRGQFAKKLVEDVEDRCALSLSDDEREQIVELVKDGDLVGDSEKFEAKVKDLAEEIRAEGRLPKILDQYIATSGIDKSRFTDAVKRSMLAYLRRIGVEANPRGPKPGEKYDELFSLAYNHAIENADGEGADPIDAIRQKGRITDWNFQVDTFETVEEQGVIPANVRAAGALAYVYELGERLGIFKLADAVVHRWASGQIDLESGESTAKLYRYWKLRPERMQEEERAMLYKRVLNLGEGELLSGSVANEQFPVLWGSLMEKVTDYITRTEEKKSEERSISRTPIYQVTKQLQYNLTEFMTGMAHLQVTEMYRQMQEAKSILEDSRIVDYFGNGRRRSLWTVIERGHRDFLGESVNIAAIRTSAVDGNRVFQWIANFDQATVSDAAFEEFREAAEAWIISQSMEGEEPVTVGVNESPSTNGKQDEFDSDWDR
jgi:hypothetical protein